MNPYLRVARARYDALQAQTAEFSARLTAGAHHQPGEHEAHERALAEGTELRAAIQEMEETGHREAASNALAAQVAADRGTDGGGALGYVGGHSLTHTPEESQDRAAALPGLMPSPEQLVELRAVIDDQRAVRVPVDSRDTQHRAAVTTTQTGRPVAGPSAAGNREPRRILASAGIPVERVAGVSGLAFPVFGAGAANIVAEGAVKPEYAAITAGTATPQMISVWTDFTRQATLSMPGFESRLRNKLAALVAKREDQLVVAKVLATIGIQTYAAPLAATPYADTLLGAAGLVLASDVAQAPNLAIIAPADVPKIFGGGVGANGESPDAELRLDLHGMDVYVSSAMTAGAAIVGAWNVASRIVLGMQPTMFVDAMTGLKSNLITHLLEEAVDLAIEEPTGFVSVDFITP